MDRQTFRCVYSALTESHPRDAERSNALWARAQEAAAPEHVPTNVGTFMSDEICCSCGIWRSNLYFDGLEYAMNEWLSHVAEESDINTPQEQ